MLSQENKNKLTEEENAIAFREAARAARGLAKSMVLGERNPDPMRHREAENPAHPGATVIRILRPRPASIQVEDIDKVRSHNDYVASLGREGTKFQ